MQYATPVIAAPNVSTTSSFAANTTVDLFIREAFEQCGIAGNTITVPMISSALMSANLALTEWLGKGPNTWMRKRRMLQLYYGQPTYQLPVTVSKVVDVIASTPVILSNGAAAISSAVASGNPFAVFQYGNTTGCTLGTANGFIGMDFGAGNPQSVSYIGICALNPNTKTQGVNTYGEPTIINSNAYTIVVEYSFSGMVDDWILAPTDVNCEIYPYNRMLWIVNPSPVTCRYWRIRETGGATLAVANIYLTQPQGAFNNSQGMGTGDRALGPVSYTAWMNYGNKMNIATPSGYFFDSQTIPTVTLWPVPNVNTMCLLYTAYLYPQDVTALFQLFNIPQRFLSALVADLAVKLAAKFKTQDIQLRGLLKQSAQEAWALSANTDGSNFTLSFQPDFTSLSSST